MVQQENYDIIAITEIWWEDSHNWSAAMDDKELFRRDRQGWECFDHLEFSDGDVRIEYFRVRIGRKVNKEYVMGVS